MSLSSTTTSFSTLSISAVLIPKSETLIGLVALVQVPVPPIQIVYPESAVTFNASAVSAAVNVNSLPSTALLVINPS